MGSRTTWSSSICALGVSTGSLTLSLGVSRLTHTRLSKDALQSSKRSARGRSLDALDSVVNHMLRYLKQAPLGINSLIFGRWLFLAVLASISEQAFADGLWP